MNPSQGPASQGVEFAIRDAGLTTVESVFSKKARVSINGGLSKISGPHIFQSQDEKKYTIMISVHIRRCEGKELCRSPRHSRRRQVDDQRAHDETK